MARSIELLEALVRVDPTNAEYGIELVRSYGNLGATLPDLAGSLEAYHRASEVSAAMARIYPTVLAFHATKPGSTRKQAAFSAGWAAPSKALSS